MLAAEENGSGAVDPASCLSKVSIYLDGATDTYLESIRAHGRMAQPKLDATRSAIVRLALNRLAKDLGPAEVVEALRSNAGSQNRPGRKRL